MYGYKCEYCEGTVRPKKVKREAFKHKTGFVILEDLIIGVCDLCGSRYYSADILHAVFGAGVHPLNPNEQRQGGRSGLLRHAQQNRSGRAVFRIGVTRSVRTRFLRLVASEHN